MVEQTSFAYFLAIVPKIDTVILSIRQGPPPNTITLQFSAPGTLNLIAPTCWWSVVSWPGKRRPSVVRAESSIYFSKRSHSRSKTTSGRSLLSHLFPKTGCCLLFIKPHEHWYIDVSYLNICGTFYYLCSFLDGCSRSIIHWEIREQMTERDVEIILERAKEKYPEARPRIISDPPQFIAKDFKKFIRISRMTHVRASPYHPQSNGEL